MKYTQLAKEERDLICALLAEGGHSIRDIAKRIGRSPSTIHREIKRNSVEGVYDPERAHQKAVETRVHRGQAGYVIHGETKEIIDSLREENLSAYQISERLKTAHNIYINTSTIYRYIRRDRRDKNSGEECT